MVGAAGIRATRLIEVDGTGRQRSGAPVDAADLAWLRRHWPDAADTADIGTTRDAAWADLCARVDDGLVVAVDYGHLADDRPPGSTLVGYRRGRPTDPVPNGSTDLTAHVAVDTLAGAVLRRQRDVLAPHAPARPMHDLARSDPARYLAELGRRGAWDALTARGGLGDFWWAIRRVRAD